MASQKLKKARQTAYSQDKETEHIVREMLAEIGEDGEEAARRFGEKLDSYSGEIVLSTDEIRRAGSKVSETLKDDIGFAFQRVQSFAKAQRDSVQEFETELSPGLWAGQKIIPIETAGCYVPGGRYAHVASAIMSVATAKVAGVSNVIATTAPRGDSGPNPAIVYTAHLCGADHILALGGVQGIAALAFGLFSGHAARILVGPGNRFVAEAKRLLYGRVGIDLFAGPTEIAVIADRHADAEIVAVDLVSQAEHGLDSPIWLIATDRTLAEAVMKRVPALIAELPDLSRQAAEQAWGNYAEVTLCDSNEEAAQVSDDYAAEHLEVQTADNDWFVARLKNYGSLFIGEETTVSYGDKCSGTNHILPTKGAAHYTGGLSAHKFLKILTTQRMTREANAMVGAAAARISRLEGMEAHARSGDVRLRKYQHLS